MCHSVEEERRREFKGREERKAHNLGQERKQKGDQEGLCMWGCSQRLGAPTEDRRP